jgi:hypothetical protein
MRQGWTEDGSTNSVCPEQLLVSSIWLFECLILLCPLLSSACGLRRERHSLPAELEAAIGTVSADIAAERYEKIYNEASDLWRQDSKPEDSNAVFKTLASKLGKVESRTLNSAIEQENSGGALKGHVYIVTYQTKFERGEGMETFTLIEQDHQWLLAKYFVNSTALQ